MIKRVSFQLTEFIYKFGVMYMLKSLNIVHKHDLHRHVITSSLHTSFIAAGPWAAFPQGSGYTKVNSFKSRFQRLAVFTLFKNVSFIIEHT